MIEIKDRIKQIRKEKGLTQAEFANALGVKQNTIATYEIGRIAPSDAIILSICREFSVNELWLRSGEGEPFRAVQKNQLIQSFIDSILKDEPEGPKARLVSALAGLDEHGWDVLVELAQKMVSENAGSRTEERAKTVPSAAEPFPSGLSPDEQELVRQYREKKNQAEKSSASAAG